MISKPDKIITFAAVQPAWLFLVSDCSDGAGDTTIGAAVTSLPEVTASQIVPQKETGLEKAHLFRQDGILAIPLASPPL